jgi:hypothetical protein
LDENGRYVCTGIIDTLKDDEEYSDEKMDKVVLIMPLPDHTTLNEFDGF